MTPNPVLKRCRKAFDRAVPWRRRLVLVVIIGALTSLALVSSARFDERVGVNSSNSPVSGDQRRQPQRPALLSGVKQDEAPMADAVRVDIPAVKPKIFRGDVRGLPLVKPKKN